MAYGAIFLLASLIVAVQARRRGYPFLVWLVAGTLGNPIFLLILLGIMPDFRRKNMRKNEMADLEDRLRRSPRRLPAALPAESSEAAREPLQRSLGDQETAAPFQRSIGDDQTRL